MKKYGKHTILGWSWRILMWVALTPFLLFIIAFLLIYFPPVQKWAVDKAAETLSEEMDMDVTVESVYLKFPLDLSMGGMLAVQDGDTVIDARELDISIKALPLFELKAEVDDIHLYDAKVYTKELIDACIIKGYITELCLDSHSTDIVQELAVVNKALLRDADLTVMLADSVPEDTTTSEPVNWRIQIDDIELQNVKATVLLTPNADSTYVMGNIGNAHATAFLDLGKEIYNVSKLTVKESAASFELKKEPALKEQFDPSHILFSDLALDVDSFSYKGTGDLSLKVANLQGKEQSGLVISEAHGAVQMDSVSLTVPHFHVKTKDSALDFGYRMDMNAFDEINPGIFTAAARGQIGKEDIIFFTNMGGEATRDVRTMMAQYLPARPTEVKLKAEGNLQSLNVTDIAVNVPSLAQVKGECWLWDIVDDLSLKTTLDANVGKTLAASIDASYVVASETYNVTADFKDAVVNEFVPMADHLALAGHVKANGHGFDFMSSNTELSADIDLLKGHFGKINLSNIKAEADLTGNKLLLDMACDNEQIQTDFTLDGEIRKNLIAGILNINLPFVDVQSMGFSEDRLQASTSGVFDFRYDLNRLFKVESNIDALNLVLGKDSIVTDQFYLMAEALKDTTAAKVRTGDLDVSFVTPYNMFSLMPKVEKLAKVATAQFKKHDVDINSLKAYLPIVSLHVDAGNNNPAADILRTYGISFNELNADIEASPDRGLVSDGHIYSFMRDSLRIDTAYFDIVQDSAQLDFHAGVRCKDQPLIPAFKAYLDGYLTASSADARLTYFDKEDKKGIDLGVHALANDTCVNFNLYPDVPTIGYRQFALNDDNYIRTYLDRPFEADVKLKSMSDSCYIQIGAFENEYHKQTINAIIDNLNLHELLSVIPVPIPDMSGNLDFNANYIEQTEGFLVNGDMEALRFTYNGMSVGDIASRFNYVPIGDKAHSIDADLKFNGTDVATVKGEYDTEGKGAINADVTLNSIPLSMVSPFIPDQIVALTGNMNGGINITGPTDAFIVNGALIPQDVHVISNQYSVDLALANDPIRFNNSRVDFDQFEFRGSGENPLTLNGYVDFSNLDEVLMALSLRGRNFKLIDAQRSSKKVLFGEMYGDFFARVIGSTKDLTVRGYVNVLSSTNLTYILTETPLYQGDRLEDIVTFVDFNAPPPPLDEIEKKTYMGIDMNVVLNIEDGAQLNGEFSADRQSYVKVQGGGAITMGYTPEGVFSLQGRYTINEGQMKYTLPVIPLKTFTIHNGSYIEFTGVPSNPILNIAATERTKATVSELEGTSRSVTFDCGLKITNTLEDMGLEFTIEAPEDLYVQNELANMPSEDKNKLAVAMLATGMYLSGTNRKGFTAGNALNAFLQNEINNIAGKALSTMVNIDVGMEQTVRDDGTKRTDYSFKFSRHFLSDKLNVIIGGKVTADNGENRSEGAYIDDISLEWRLDNGGTQYVRLFHEKDYSNLIEGELDKNGAGVVLRKKVDKFSDLFLWLRKKEKDPDSEKNTNDNSNVVKSAETKENVNEENGNENKDDSNR